MNERKIKREVVAKKARYQKGVLRMVRPIFRPLEYDLLERIPKESIAFENEKLIALLPSDELNNIRTGIDMKDKHITPLDKAKSEIYQCDRDALVISLDTEYKEIPLENEEGLTRREILSYQVACYYKGRICRLLIFSKSRELLALADIIQVFYDAPELEFKLPEHRYPIPTRVMKFKSGKVVELKDYPEGILTYVLAHNALADISTLKDFDVFYKYLTSSIDIITKEAYKTHFSVDSHNYSVLEVYFIGTMNHSNGPLAELGATKGIDIPKLEVSEDTYQDMTSYRYNHFEDFCNYGINDADIVLKWYIMLFKDLKIPSTTTSMASKVFQYFAFPGEDQKERNALTREWRGVERIKGELSFDNFYNAVGYKSIGEKGVTYLADEIDMKACICYFGGLNACMIPGFYDKKTFDYDLCGAYPTAGATLPDIDYFAKYSTLEFWYQGQEMDKIKNAKYGYNCFGFGTIDFEFPEDTKHPCIFRKHPQHGLIACLKGEDVMCTWAEVKTAFNMGAKIRFMDFKMYVPLIDDETGEVVSSCAIGYKSMIQNREIVKQVYGKKTLMEITAKLINNGTYGKMSQNVQSKTMRNIEYNVVEEKPPSLITSAPHAAYTTALVRCMLCATMEQLEKKGYACYSVTTDGFISDAPMEILQECDAYGLTQLFQSSRAFLLDDANAPVWECKHSQNYLLNVTTRINQGFDDMEVAMPVKNVNVDAHTGYKGDDFPGAYMGRTSKGIDFEMLQLPSLADLCYGYMDYTGKRVPKNIKANYDFKRRIDIDTLHDQELTFRGGTFTVPNFETKPYETYEDYLKASENMGSIKFSILTAEEYDNIFNAMMTGTYKKSTPLKKQVDACLYHLRQDAKSIPLVQNFVRSKGLQDTIWLIENTMKKSYLAYQKKHPEETEEWKYELDKGIWRNLSRVERFKKEDYTALSKWLEEAIIYVLENHD